MGHQQTGRPMAAGLSSNPPFQLLSADQHAPANGLLRLAAPMIERMTGLDQLNAVYHGAEIGDASRPFVARVLDQLGVQWRASAEDLGRIPRTGAALVVANHPFGALEGVVLAAILQSVRLDIKILANYLLERIAAMRDLFFFVDPFGDAAAKNAAPLRQALRWVQGGGLLAMFPAGEVAALDVRTRAVTEPQWNELVGRLARKAGIPVLPIFFGGQNSPLFQIGGLLHPRMRTVMLPREVLNKRGSVIEARVGSPIPARKLKEFPDARSATDYVRQRTLLLSHRSRADAKPHKKAPKLHRPIVAAEAWNLIADDVHALPAENLLIENGDFQVYHAAAEKLPRLLREIGRLREITYRATGEGTGNAIDLDRFDRSYTHLFVWNKKANEIVGAYRLGMADQIVARSGIDGLYTSTLFSYRNELLARLGGAIELGRSFVRAEYQKSYAPLLLLWRGIGQYVAERPAYYMLFGPVSISNDYLSASKNLLVQFLASRHGAPELAQMTRPRQPFKAARLPATDLLLSSADVDDLVADLEPDRKGMPVLVRQYIKLGARFFAYNVDPEFNDSIDALMAVDLRQTEPKLLSRYMGPQGAAHFLRYHGVETALKSTAPSSGQN
ncbi:MAG TPA: GNAT family N-acyltransferase [Humisphaera sp.]|jgi:putative hemolysin|nr:GNAT family N-acyltransferase [Humisphaera sp.]